MRTILHASIAAFTFAAVSAPAAAQQGEPPVAINMDGLQGSPIHVRERVLSEAQKGRTALIQYLNRTQAVHQLRPQFLIGQQQPVWATARKEDTKVAQRPPEEVHK